VRKHIGVATHTHTGSHTPTGSPHRRTGTQAAHTGAQAATHRHRRTQAAARPYPEPHLWKKMGRTRHTGAQAHRTGASLYLKKYIFYTIIFCMFVMYHVKHHICNVVYIITYIM
jgi:hypothetical protein